MGCFQRALNPKFIENLCLYTFLSQLIGVFEKLLILNSTLTQCITLVWVSSSLLYWNQLLSFILSEFTPYNVVLWACLQISCVINFHLLHLRFEYRCNENFDLIVSYYLSSFCSISIFSFQNLHPLIQKIIYAMTLCKLESHFSIIPEIGNWLALTLRCHLRTLIWHLNQMNSKNREF
jgi:hypothetical protein